MLSFVSEAQTGLVTFIQRFGSALNLDIHLHILALDGATHVLVATSGSIVRRLRATRSDAGTLRIT